MITYEKLSRVKEVDIAEAAAAYVSRKILSVLGHCISYVNGNRGISHSLGFHTNKMI